MGETTFILQVYNLLVSKMLKRVDSNMPDKNMLKDETLEEVSGGVIPEDKKDVVLSLLKTG